LKARGEEIRQVFLAITKDVYTLAIEDHNAFDKHINYEMKCKGSCNGGRSRKTECTTSEIATVPFKRGRPQKGPLAYRGIIQELQTRVITLDVR